MKTKAEVFFLCGYWRVGVRYKLGLKLISTHKTKQEAEKAAKECGI